MWYRKKVGTVTTNYYKKKFDWVYLIGGIIGMIILAPYLVPPG